MEFFRETTKGSEVFIRVMPNSRQDGIMGIETRDDDRQYLKIKTRAIPEDGKANDAVIKILSKALKIPKSNIELLSGATSRTKTFILYGVSADVVRAIASN